MSRLRDVAMNLAIVCGVHEQSTAFEVIVRTLDEFADDRLQDFAQFLATADLDDWRRWAEIARQQR